MRKDQAMKKTLSLAVVASIVLLAGFVRAPAASAAVPSYTGCLSPILNTIYDVAPGDQPAHGCVRPAAVIHLSSGDVTSLVAGTGLVGGGDNGDLSLSLAPSYRLPQSCASGQMPAWNGSAWGCASGASQADFNAFVALLGSAGTINADSNPVHWTRLKGVPAGFADGTDDVGPSYAAGAGLNLAGTTFSVDPTQVQHRISDSCPAGASIRAIAQDGSVTCQAHSVYTAGAGLALDGNEFSLSFDPTTQAEFDAFTTLLGSTGTINDSTNPVDWSRLKNVPAGLADGVDDTGGADGLGAYCALVQAHPRSYEGAPCGTYRRTLDSVGSFTAVTIGADGNPVISYARAPSTELKVVHCADPVCAASTANTLDGTAFDTSIAIGTDGNPVVSYRRPSNALKVAHCSDPSCAPPTLLTLDSVAHDTSIAIGSDGNPVVSYSGPAGALKLASCGDLACGAVTKDTLDSAGSSTSIAIGTDGSPVVSYSGPGGALKVVHCDDSACEAPTSQTLDTDAASTSIAIGTDGSPVVSYSGPGGALRVAQCGDSGCAGSTLTTLDDAGDFTSIAIGTDGKLVVTYQGSGGALKLARPAISN
jgi:hypothetical protein